MALTTATNHYRLMHQFGASQGGRVDHIGQIICYRRFEVEFAMFLTRKVIKKAYYYHYAGNDWIASFHFTETKGKHGDRHRIVSPLRIRGNRDRAAEQLVHAYMVLL